MKKKDFFPQVDSFGFSFMRRLVLLAVVASDNTTVSEKEFEKKLLEANNKTESKSAALN